MVSVKEAPVKKVLEELEKELKKFPEINKPEWARFIKTGSHCERKPQKEDWWYTRCASILRKIYLKSNVGVGRLRTWYGGRKNRGSKPEKHAKAGGKVIRVALQQLEKAGLVKKEKIGRTISPKGRSLIDKITIKIKGETIGKRPRRIEKEKTEAVKGTGRVEKPSKPIDKKTVKQGSTGKTAKDKPGKSKPGRKS